MKKVLWIFLSLFTLGSLQAESASEEDSNSEEKILNFELASSEAADKEFSNLVQSTMDLMGPKLEVTQLTDQENSDSSLK